MDFETEDLLSYPRDKVFVAFRDGLLELPGYLSNIDKITLLSRTEKGGDVHVESIWDAKVSLPAPLDRLVPEGSRRWKDVATWHNKAHTVEWRVVPYFFTEAVSVSGQNTFTADGKKTRLTIRGQITIDPAKIRGVPTFLAKQFIPTIEKFLSSTITKNFKEGNRGIERYLAAKK